MSEILIQNKGPTPYFKLLSNRKNGTIGVAGQITFEGDNQITKISEEMYDKKIKDDIFFKRLIEQGTLVVLNDVGVQPQNLAAEGAASRELSYSRYKNLVLDVEKNGGNSNKELTGYLDDAGMPNLDLVRANMGQVEPYLIDEYKKRYIAEKESGSLANKLRFPGGKLASKVSTNIEDDLVKINSAKQAVKDAEVKAYTQSELEAMSREELIDITKDMKISIRNESPATKLIELIMKKQVKTDN